MKIKLKKIFGYKNLWFFILPFLFIVFSCDTHFKAEQPIINKPDLQSVENNNTPKIQVTRLLSMV